MQSLARSESMLADRLNCRYLIRTDHCRPKLAALIQNLRRKVSQRSAGFAGFGALQEIRLAS